MPTELPTGCKDYRRAWATRGESVAAKPKTKDKPGGNGAGTGVAYERAPAAQVVINRGKRMDNVIKHYFTLRRCGFKPVDAWRAAMDYQGEEEFWAEDV